MPKPLARRPSPAMLVAVTALVSSLAGPAVADEVARVAQSITSGKQIRNGIVSGADVKNESLTTADILNGGIRTEDIGTGQVTTADLRTDAVRGDKIVSNSIDGSDIQDETLRGADIFEASLGTVPRATDADRVGGRSASEFVAASALRPFDAVLDLGESQQIGQNGPLRLVAECADGGSGAAVLRIYAATSQPNSLLQSGEDVLPGGTDPAASPGDYLQPTTPKEDAELVSESSSSTFPASSSELDGGFVTASNGFYLGLDSEATSVTFNVEGARCSTAGVVQANA